MSCTFYRWNGGIMGDYWCDIKDARVNNADYYRYCRDYNYSDCPIYKKQHSSGSCFITTILCHVLGKKDDDKILENMRSFRENILKNNPKYYNILWEYDRIGPIIATCINNDSEKLKLANNLYTSILTKINEHIENEENEKAIASYQIMVLELIKHYNLKATYALVKDSFNINELDVASSGHGKVLAKTKESLA